MDFIKNLFNNNGSPIISQEELIEQNLCPNCWGKQSYDGQFRQFVIDQSKTNDGTGKKKPKAFIQQFVENHVTGIKLKKDNGQLNCPACEKTF